MPDSKTVARKGGQRALLSVLSLSVFFVGASEFMLAAMLNPLGAAFGTDTAQTTWLISSYALAYAIAAPILGHLSDRVDRRRLLLIALLSFSVDGLGIAFASGVVADLLYGGVLGRYVQNASMATDFAQTAALASAWWQHIGHAPPDAVISSITSGRAIAPVLMPTLSAPAPPSYSSR